MRKVYDIFAGEYIDESEKSPYAPPERYIDLNTTARHYIGDLEADSHWLTDYAQDKEDCQRLIEITITMNRARWLIGELIGEHDEEAE